MNATPIILKSIEKDPDCPVKPWQRLACLLYANGTPLHDVAREVNMPVEPVSQFVTCPRGIELLKTLVDENPDRMASLVEATVIDSLLRMVRLRDLGKTESVQMGAAGQLLDRFFPKSKATDPIKKGAAASDFVDMQAQIAKLREEVLEPQT